MSEFSSGLWALLAAGLAGGLALLGRRWRQETARNDRISADLQESEGRFRFIAENSSDVIWIMDLASGRFTYVSPAVYRLRGYTAAEIMAEPALAALTAESAARIKATLADAIARWHAGDRSDTRRVTAVDQPHKAGHLVATEVVTTLHGDERGPRWVLGLTRDLTERQRAAATGRNPVGPTTGRATPAGADGSADGDAAPLRFHWRSAYECGLPALDREHRTLFDNANDLLRSSLDHERDPARFMAAVDRLLRNVQQHFADEEALLQRIAYPDLAAHARRHRELVLQATHLREEARAGRISVGDWIEFVANDMVVGHLIREDRKFFPLLALATADGIAAGSDLG